MTFASPAPSHDPRSPHISPAALVGGCITALRFQAGMTQTQASALMNISQAYLSRVESGESDGSLSLALRLVDLYPRLPEVLGVVRRRLATRGCRVEVAGARGKATRARAFSMAAAYLGLVGLPVDGVSRCERSPSGFCGKVLL